ncbi:hypothetical protein [Saccharomonospora sp. NB11]|jgi:hypothetical protein|uniref:hypothetical protein n=1 Tax=Saccharomonospora sp. NB11 TaxID=1642298 RepID=UPI0018D0F181|nr:hypothetical protein [Saccharomonospora sp. NB11]
MGSKGLTTQTVGDATKNGARALRDRAVEAGKVSAEVAAQAAQVAEQRLSESTEIARKELARRAAQTRKEAVRNAKEARTVAELRTKELRKPGRKAKKAALKAAKAAGQSRRRAKRDFRAAKKEFKAAMAEAKAVSKRGVAKRGRRRWPWLLGLAALAGAAAYAKSRQDEPAIAPVPPRSTDAPSTTTSSGQATNPAPGQQSTPTTQGSKSAES